jgi:ABC-type branched-subunit amino acid transport system substrate-binding protein
MSGTGVTRFTTGCIACLMGLLAPCLIAAAENVPPIGSAGPNTLELAVLGPLTPSSKAFGTPHLQGITLAVDEYNQQHAASGRAVKLSIFDDKAEPEIGTAIVRSLTNSHALAVLGPANSAVAIAISELLKTQALRLPIVSSLATATELTGDASPGYFLRANVSDKVRLTTLLNLIFNDTDRRPRRLIALYEQNDAFGEGMLRDAKAWLQVNERNFLEHDTLELPYSRNLSKDVASQLIARAYQSNFAAKGDAMLVLGIASDAITFIEAVRSSNGGPDIYFNEPDYPIFKAAAARGVLVAGVHVVSVYWPENATVNSFHSSFVRRFSEEPSFSAALSYDAARLVLRAIDVTFDQQQQAPLDIQASRDRILLNLRNDAGPALDYVISGDHRFQNGEFRELDFQGLQFDSTGELIQWNQNPQKTDVLQFGQSKPIIVPPYLDLALVFIFGFIGSTIREFNRRPPENIWQLPVRLLSPISLIVDPAISLIVFGCMFLLAILTKRTLLEEGGDALLIYLVAAIAMGAVSGFLGIRALFAVIKYMGINIKEEDIVGPAAVAIKPARVPDAEVGDPSG